MTSDTHTSAARLALLGRVEGVLAAVPRAVEDEVIELFDQLRDGLMRYAMSLGIGAADAEDVIQEVFLALHGHLRRGRPRANLRGWVFRVAHNLALKQRQRAQRQQAKGAAGQETLAAQLDPGGTPEEQLAERQQQKRLLLVVAALAEQDQRCLRLRAEGLRYREIAEVMGISLGAVAKSLARSIERLMSAEGRARP